MTKLVSALNNGGKLRSQDGTFGSQAGAEQTEAILAGLVAASDGNGMVKPQTSSAPQTVKLNFGKRKAQAAAAAAPAQPAQVVNNVATSTIAQPSQSSILKTTPAGVGFIENDADLDMDYEDDGLDDFPSNEELERAGNIDPDTLLSAEDRLKPLNIRM
jgi:hypothetical protein